MHVLTCRLTPPHAWFAAFRYYLGANTVIGCLLLPPAATDSALEPLLAARQLMASVVQKGGDLQRSGGGGVVADSKFKCIYLSESLSLSNYYGLFPYNP